MEQDKNQGNADNIPSIPMSVLDRFLKLTQEQHESYAAMVSAVDSMSAKMMELADQVGTITDTIVKEQLAKGVEDLKSEVAALKTVVSGIGSSEFNVVSVLAESLKFEKGDVKEAKKLAEALGGLLSVVAFFQKRKLIFVFVMGAVIVALAGTAGEGVKSVFKFIIGLL